VSRTARAILIAAAAVLLCAAGVAAAGWVDGWETAALALFAAACFALSFMP
jgi:hypothetical protein